MNASSSGNPSLQDRLSAATKEAMLARDTDRVGVLRMVRSSLGYASIELKKDALTDEEILVVLRREAKKRADAAEEYERGGRPELAAREKAELTVIREFLPASMSDEELESLVRAVIQELGASGKAEMGRVMKAATARSGGRVDGRTLSGVVNRLLA